ncbi:lipopolysaccharide biosynthesis protein [Emticicia sp. TH156]|uniref:lipopolysaccharide biosynthesis protein n=1 Tax=Emticicia sp. TH156 TaxID=2067454 RepID=UPI000C760A45|nr:hypothetical protein [Emticicia sp. TH156]PLK44036.1 hypothetical protein C0V77_12855 [Emticicia sp. TH156]
MNQAKRVVFNTGITYAKAAVTVFISLYTTRLVLNALGAEDFGLYNVIGGLIAMLAFLNSVMTTSTQRYISLSLGGGDIGNIKRIFANSIIAHLIIGVVILIGIEVTGMYFIYNKLQINHTRISTAVYILHFVSVSTFLTVISVPYDAVVNAHENMTFLAIIGVFETILRFLAAIVIFYFGEDKLLLYGLLMLVVSFVIRLIKQIYCTRKYPECTVSLKAEYSKKQIVELGSFAGWQLFGNLAAIARNQGVAVVLNLFYTTVVNAAYGVANQINTQLMFFSETMLSAVRPQIMKSEGANDRARMIRLALTANRFAFYLFTFFAVPFYFELPFILKLWLANVPDYSVEFCRAIILLTMASQINQGLITAVQAIGKIKVYQMVAGGILLLTLPVGYVFLKLGYPPQYIILVGFGLECISTVFRIFYFNYLTGYSVKEYFKGVIFDSFASLLPTVLIVWFVQQHLHGEWFKFIITCLVSGVTYIGFIYLLGLKDTEKTMIAQLIQTAKKKVFKS